MLACLLCVGMGAWAADVVSYTFKTAQSDANSAYATNYNVEVDNKTWSCPGNQSYDGYVRIGGKNLANEKREIYSKTTLTDDITKVVLNHNGVSNASLIVHSIKLTVASDAAFTTDVQTKELPSPSVSSSGSLTFSPTSGTWGANKYYKITFELTNNNNNKNYGIDVASIVFYKDNGGAPQTKYNVTVANNIANGTVTASPTSAAEGEEVTLTATPASGYMFGSWNVTNASTSESITVTDNKFTMPAADVNVSATFNQIVALATVSEIFAAATAAGTTATDCFVTFNNYIVSGVKGNNAYVTDNAGNGFIIYERDHGFVAGDILNGTVACKVQLYRGSAEITTLTSLTNGLTVTKGGIVTPVTSIALATLSGVNTGAVLSYQDLTYDGTNFTDGVTSLKPYNTFVTLPTLVSGKKYDVTGVYIQYNDTKEIAPRTAEDFVLDEVINKYVVSFDVTENGTITVKDGETVINEGDEVAEGTTLTIECSPANADYRFKNWQYKAGEAAWATRQTNPQDYQMPSANVQFRANFELIPVYTVSWSVNGSTVKSEDLKEGADVTAPDVVAPAGKVFRGWATSPIDGTTNVAPELVTPNATATAAATYYAVFATQTGSGEITYTKLTSNSFEEDVDYVIAAEESSEVKTLHYFSSYTKTTANESWGVTSTDADKAIVFSLSGTANALVAQDEKNNYLEALKTGKFKMSSISTTLKLNNDGRIYNPAQDSQWNMRYNHNNGSGGFRWYSSPTGCSAYFYKKEVDATYSDYCTTVAPAPSSVDVTISAAGYATFYDAVHKVELPAGVSGYVAYMDGETFTFGEAYEPGQVVPAGEPIVLKGAGNVTLNFSDQTAEDSWKEAGMNDLIGTATDITAEQMADANPGMGRFYALSLNANNELNSVGFYWMNETGAAFALGAGKCYFALPAAATAKGFRFNNTTGIKDVKTAALNGAAFNLNGQRVAANAKGIVIVNGKKMLNK